MKKILSPGLGVFALLILMCLLHSMVPDSPMAMRIVFLIFSALFVFRLVKSFTIDWVENGGERVWLLLASVGLPVFSLQAFQPVPVIIDAWVIRSVIVIGFLSFLSSEKIKQVRLRRVIYYVGVILLFLSGNLLVINGAFDGSREQFFQSSVVRKYSGGGRIIAHFLQVNPFADFRRPADIRVNRNVWRKLANQEEIEIGVHPGLFLIPWFSKVRPATVRSDRTH